MTLPPDTDHAESQSLPFEETLTKIRALLPEKLHKPHVGIVCGSGLHTLAAAIREVVEVPYASLPGFGKSTGTQQLTLWSDGYIRLTYRWIRITPMTVPGHKSSLAFGLIGPGAGTPVVVMLGRVRSH